MSYGQATIEIVNQEKLSPLLQSWLESYVQKGQLSDGEWLESKLAEFAPSSAKETAAFIIESAKNITRAKESLSSARERGIGREEWFFRELRNAAQDMDDNSFGELASGMGDAIGQNLPQEVSDLWSGKSESLKNAATVWNEHSAKEEVFSSSKTLGLLTISALSQIDESEDGSFPQGVESRFKDQITDVLLNKNDEGAIICVSGALSTALEQQIIKIDGPPMESWERTATIVGTAAQSVGLIRIAHDLAIGVIDTAEEAINAYIDVAVETVAGSAVTVCRQCGQAAGGVVGGFLGGLAARVFGPPATVAGAKIGGAIGGFLGEKLGGTIRSGITTIGGYAKDTVSYVADKARKAVGWVGDKVSRAWDSVTNFFS